MPDPLRVAVVVLNWNGLQMTLECLAALRAQTRPVDEIVVVDNASMHCEADAIARVLGPNDRLIRSATNRGFAGGANLALERVLAERRCCHVALLNNDAVAEPGWLEALVRAAQADPSIGAVASKMVFFADPQRIENAAVHLLSCGDNVPRGRGDLASAWDRPEDVLAFCGGAVLLRAAMLERIGLFRADFFANFEDVDLSLRAVTTGSRIRYEPGAVVRHHLNASILKIRSVEFDVRSVRNSTWAYFVNAPVELIFCNLPGLLLVNLALVLGLALTGRSAFAAAVVRGRWWAWCERHQIAAERDRLAALRRPGTHAMWQAQRAWWLEALARLVPRGKFGRSSQTGAGSSRRQGLDTFIT